jgi:hypothetical protein
MELVAESETLSYDDFIEKRCSDIEKHLKKIDRRDLIIYGDEDFDAELSIEECVKVLLEKYPVKKISSKVYKPNESSDKY